MGLIAESNRKWWLLTAVSGDPDAIRQFYKKWSETYDTDLLQDIGYAGPEVAARAMCRQVADTAVLLDAGCGTGLVGAALTRHKPGLVIDGIDLTPGMLARSREKGVYRNLSEADLSRPLHDIPHRHYDGVISAGVFTYGHVGPEGVDAPVGIAKTGAPIVLTVRDGAWETEGFDKKIRRLEADGLTKTLNIEHSPYHANEGVFCQLVELEAV